MKDIFNNDSFWISFVIVTVMGTIVAGMSIDTYLDNKQLKYKLDSGLQQCMVQLPGASTQILWQKECDVNIIKSESPK